MGRRKKKTTPEQRLAHRQALEEQRARAKELQNALEATARTIAARWTLIIKDFDHPELRPIGEWIVDNAINGEAWEIIEIDSGYDVSTGAMPTGRHHKIADFDTVEQFLDTPNGQTVPTFVSGSGLAADTLLTDYESHCADFLAEWVDSQPEVMDLDEDARWELLNNIDAECEKAGLDHRMGLLQFLDLSLEDAIRRWPVEIDPQVNLLPAEDPDLPAELATFLDRFPKDLKDHHLTFVTPDGLATFASGNASYLPEWWREEAVRIVCIPERRTILNRRIFTAMKDVESGLPIKRLSSCVLHSGGIEPQNADTTRHAFTTDFETGKPLEAMPATIYEAF